MCWAYADLPQLEIATYLKGGKDCQFFCESEEIRELISSAPWDYVVLMDSSWGPIEHQDTFNAYMPKLIELVQQQGAQPILYAYNGPRRHTREQRLFLQEQYQRMGDRYRVPVIPCAAALAEAQQRYPYDNFHNADTHHGGLRMGYLFACVWFQCLTGMKASVLPEAFTLGGHVDVPAEVAQAMQEVADKVVTDYIQEHRCLLIFCWWSRKHENFIRKVGSSTYG